MRARIVEKLAWLGAELDPAANAAGDTAIAAPDSRIGLYVVADRRGAHDRAPHPGPAGGARNAAGARTGRRMTHCQ